ncbi:MULTISPECIES: DUF7269 family protein [Halococcus]|uniref:Uncharacterized protein n=1 Tax=Halococcus salifodinae DSM 8989 TaxID=1227456 RepID=M0N3I7_9EURY|nr:MULTISPECIES: hypothetical protein [Halococcus]EMA51270.1 hypothetical protein C450_12370 [Halococcus salifodinae DSM 8989]
MDNFSRTSIRRWIMLAAFILVATAILITGIAAVDPSLLDILRHPREGVFLITGFLVVALFSGSLLSIPLYLDPKDTSTKPEDADTDAYEPEVTPEIPHAGAEIEPLTGNPFLGYRVTDDEQEAIRTRLRDAAVTMTHRHTGIKMEDASARVQRGDWTENATAAWFLGETPPPRSVRLYARVSDGHAFRHGARQTVHEIVAYEQRHESRRTHSP